MVIWQWLFGCRCNRGRESFPITPRKRGRLQKTYVVCLDCGTEYPYDWRTMQRLEPPKLRKVKRQLLPLINADER
jgi:hypothetical protein